MDFHNKLQQIQRQFLCALPLNSIDWQKLAQCKGWEEQKLILDATCDHPLNQKKPIKIGYQLNFLKRLLQTLESSCTEVHDDLYEKYCQLQQLATVEEHQKFAYKHYLLPEYQTHFTLRESKCFVAEGTTGLCSWQASMALADYLLHHPDVVQGKSVLELGAGTGLCGFIIERCCRARSVCLTDGSAECVDLMREHVRTNFPQAVGNLKGHFELPSKRMLTCCQLRWENSAETKQVTEVTQPDVILAADVVYDTSVLADLSKTIDFIFKTMLNKPEMFLAATVRNEETLDTFLKLLTDLRFTAVEKEVISWEESYLFWDRTTPVKIFLLKRPL